MFYYKVRLYDYDNASSAIYSSERDLKKEDVIVVPDYDNVPTTAIVVERVREFLALTNEAGIEEIICVVDMKAYNANLEKKLKMSRLISKMNDEVSRVKNLETLKKYADKDDSMRELMKEFEALTAKSQDENVSD